MIDNEPFAEVKGGNHQDSKRRISQRYGQAIHKRRNNLQIHRAKKMSIFSNLRDANFKQLEVPFFSSLSYWRCQAVLSHNAVESRCGCSPWRRRVAVSTGTHVYTSEPLQISTNIY